MNPHDEERGDTLFRQIAEAAIPDPADPMDPETQRRFNRALARRRQLMQPLLDEVKESECLTAEDFSVTIGPCHDIRG